MLLFIGGFLLLACGVAFIPCVPCPNEGHHIRYWHSNVGRFTADSPVCPTCRTEYGCLTGRTTLLRRWKYQLGVTG